MTETKMPKVVDYFTTDADYTLELVRKLNNANLDYKAHYSVTETNDIEVYLNSKEENVFYLKNVYNGHSDAIWEFQELQWVLKNVIETNSFREPTDEDLCD